MAANTLPDEVLHVIFRNLYGIPVVRSREVCRRWKEAVDSLSDRDWEKICSNDDLYSEYAAARGKYGLSWQDTFKAFMSWTRIESYEMSTQELCAQLEHFKVLPNGIVASLYNRKHKRDHGYSDTIVYYNTETFQICGEEEFDFSFIPHLYDENEYLRVFVSVDANLRIVVKDTKQQFIVGSLQSGYQCKVWELALIGKEVYFKNSNDDIIYVSKLKKENEALTVETKQLEAFEKNHESFEETIVGFSIVNGNVNILSDEGNKGNVYVHENADFTWAAQCTYDDPDIFYELKLQGFNWKSPAIYNWIRLCTTLSNRPAFYSHGSVYLTTRSYGKQLCIHYLPYHIWGPDHLVQLFKLTPDRKISTEELLIDAGCRVSQLDIIETATSHKVLVMTDKKLFVLEFTPGNKDKKKHKSSVVDKNSFKVEQETNTTAGMSGQILSKESHSEQSQQKKKSQMKPTFQTMKKNAQIKKRSVLRVKKDRKPTCHYYATRSKTKV